MSARYRFAACAAVLLACLHTGVAVVSPDVVISQVYGGGGNTRAPYTHDYIELYNRGTTAVSLNEWSLQYASAAGTGNFGSAANLITPLSGSIAPGQYILVQEGAGAGNGSPLPTPDVTDLSSPIAMSASAGKVALVSGTTPLGCNGGSTPCSPDALARIVDLVGYGNANFFEGSGAAPTLSNTTAAFRLGGGSIDTDDNVADFMAAPPMPRNSGASTTPVLTIADVTVAEGDFGTTEATFTVSLSAPAKASGVTFDIATHDETAQAGEDYIALLLAGEFIPQGSSSKTYSVLVTGDLAVEPDETFAVDVASVGGDVTVGDAHAVGTITNDDVPTFALHEIQGNGQTSSFVNQIVATTGIVTGAKSNGFFIQAPEAEADLDADTSEGLFVFTGSPRPVAVGDGVRVTGRVSEFKRNDDRLPETLTELSGSVTVSVQTSGNPLPPAVDAATFDVHAPSRAAQLERYEGMRVKVGTLVVVGPTNGFGEFFGVLEGTPRPFREPGIEITDAVPPEAVSPGTIPRFDGNYERIMADSDELLTATGAQRVRFQVSSGALVTGIGGPLDYAFDTYRIELDASAAPVVSGGIDQAVPAPEALGDEFTIAALNLQNFFPGAAFNNRLTKAALTIRNVLRTPDILGLIEVGDIDVLRQLRDCVNAEAGTSYEAYLLEGDPRPGNDQDVGYLVNLARVEVVGEPFQVYEGVRFTFAGVDDGLLFDRPPLVLEARVGHSGLPVTVILSHLRSLIDVNSTAPFLVNGAPSGFTLGQRVREKRRLGAESMADLIELRQHDNLVVIGDLNAFEFSDGYVDVVGTLKGAPAPAEQVATASADRWDHELFDLADLVPPSERYSFVFEGSAQVLDHVLVNQAMRSRLSRLLYARNNADFAESFGGDATRTERLSDHDAPTAFFREVADLRVEKTGDDIVEDGRTSYGLTITNQGLDPALAVRLSDTLPAGMSVVSVDAPQGWSCATSPGSVTCEAEALAAGASAAITIDAVVDCAIADGTVLTNVASVRSSTHDVDESNNTAQTVTRVSNPPPVISGLSVDPRVLWPPNDRLRKVTVSYTVTDTCGPVTTSLSVTSSDTHDRKHHRRPEVDWIVIDAHHVLLRAEHSRHGTARIYTVTATATDAGGNTSQKSAKVIVPRRRLHDR